ENYNCFKVDAGDNAFPSDRYRCYLPLGGSSGNGAGTYYFKIRSASGHPNFYDKEYKLYMQTNTVGYQGMAAMSETESNGGGDCGQANNVLPLGVDMLADIDNIGGCGNFCGIDEYAVTISSSDYDSNGDTLWIFMNNTTDGYTDHFIAGLWSGALSMDIQSQIKYQTYTDFTNLPSGQGGMNYLNFKPNGNPTQLNGDWDWLWFFYDYDQNVASTRSTLIDWSKWLFNDVGIGGLRMDAVKHFDPAFVGTLLDSLASSTIESNMIVGEFFDGNPSLLKNWVDAVKANMNADALDAYDVRLFDFALRGALKAACDAFGYDARQVFNSGMVDAVGSAGSEVVTFINNHDFREEGQAVENDPMLAYAYILTNNKVGLPCVFFPDYFGTDLPHGGGEELGPQIKELMSIHANHITGSSNVDYLNRIGTSYASNYISGFDNTTLLYQIQNNPMGSEVIVAINFAGESLKLEHDINLSNLISGDTLFELTSNSNTPQLVIDGSKVQIELPARSYAVWVNSANYNCSGPTRIYVNPLASGNNSGIDWKNAYTNLQSALNKASICSDVEEIWVASSSYKPSSFDNRSSSFTIPSNVNVYGGFPNTGNPGLPDRDWDTHASILDGDIGIANDAFDNSFHVVSIPSTSSASTLDGFTIQNGNANGISTLDQVGGGILGLGQCALKNSIIQTCNGTSGTCVGAINPDANVSLEACTIRINASSNKPVQCINGATLEFKGAVDVVEE
ncbi:MAG: alpha-amylase family glycosyl hydrolase, partial [Bacteroidota bacterium]